MEVLRAVRGAASDFNAHPGPYVIGNLVWSAVLVVVVLVASAWPLLFFVAILLALPYTGLQRMALVHVREGQPTFEDFRDGWRRLGARGLALGGLAAGIAAILVVDYEYATGRGDLVGSAIIGAVLPAMVALAALALVAWPLLVDPARDGIGIRDVLIGAVRLCLLHPGRVLGLTATAGVVTVISVLLVVPVFFVTTAFTTLLCARIVTRVDDTVLTGR